MMVFVRIRIFGMFHILQRETLPTDCAATQCGDNNVQYYATILTLDSNKCFLNLTALEIKSDTSDECTEDNRMLFLFLPCLLTLQDLMYAQ